jgi:hypothetical protein
MKRVLAIVLGLCLLSGLSVNADIDTIEGSTIAGGEECTQGSANSSDDFEGGVDGNEVSGDGDWTEANSSTNIFTYEDTSPLSGSMSLFIDNVGAAETNRLTYWTPDTTLTGSGSRCIKFKLSTADGTGQYNFLRISDGNSEIGGNRRIELRFDSDSLEVYDGNEGSAAWTDIIASTSDDTTYSITISIDLDTDPASGDVVEIFVDGVSSGTFDCLFVADPDGIDRLSFYNNNGASRGDIKIDDIEVYTSPCCPD